MPEENHWNQYRRITTRALWHDYNGGMYFITICTKDKEHYFGEITDGVMNLSEIGKCLQEQIVKTPEIRADMNVEMPLFVIMPNHVHLIIIIGENQYNTTTCSGAMHCAATNDKPINKFAPQSKKSSVSNSWNKNINNNICSQKWIYIFMANPIL